MKNDTLKLKDLAGQTLYLRIKVTRQLRLRLAAAKVLFRLASALLGCKVEFV